MIKFLIFNPSYLGDSILTTPLIKAVKKLYPDSYIAFCVRPEYIGLFGGLNFINEVISFDKRRYDGGIRGTINFYKFLREKAFDIIISPHLSIRSTIVTSLSHIPLRIGFKQAKLNSLYTHTVEKDRYKHEVVRYLELLKPVIEARLTNKNPSIELGSKKEYELSVLKNIAGQPETYTDNFTYEKVNMFFKVISKGYSIVGINPTSIWPTKRWPVKKYAELMNKFYKNNIISVLFAGPDEKNTIEEISKYINVPFIDLAGKTTLRELPSIIKTLDLFITNDSGPMHIAVSQDTPTVAIFGPTTEHLGFFPYDTKSTVIEIKDLPCRPCCRHGGINCPKRHFKCMNDISVDEVLKAALTYIK